MLQIGIILAIAWGAARAAAFLPDGAVIALFCRIPAHCAAFFYGASVEGCPPAFHACGITVEVGRSCAGLLAFTLLCGFSFPFFRRRWLWLWLPGCWGVLLFCNTLRLIAVAPLTALLIDAELMRFERLVHQMAGALFFLPLPAYLAWCLEHGGNSGNE